MGPKRGRAFHLVTFDPATHKRLRNVSTFTEQEQEAEQENERRRGRETTAASRDRNREANNAVRRQQYSQMSPDERQQEQERVRTLVQNMRQRTQDAEYMTLDELKELDPALWPISLEAKRLIVNNCINRINGMTERVCAVCDHLVTTATSSLHIVEQLPLDSMRQALRSRRELPESLQTQYDQSSMHPALEGMLLSRKGVRTGADEVVRLCICKSCFKALRRRSTTPPKFAIANGFEIGELPPEHGNLNKTEVEFLALGHSTAKFIVLRGGQQRAISSHCLHFKCNSQGSLAPLVDKLPRNTNAQLRVIIAGPFTPAQQLAVRRKYAVRVDKLHAFHQFLRENNFLYSNVPVDEAAYESLRQDGLPDDFIVPTGEDRDAESHTTTAGRRTATTVEDETVFQEENSMFADAETDQIPLLQALQNDPESVDGTFVARRGNEILSDYERFFFPYLFPDLFPYAFGHPRDDRPVKVNSQLDAQEIDNYQLVANQVAERGDYSQLPRSQPQRVDPEELAKGVAELTAEQDEMEEQTEQEQQQQDAPLRSHFRTVDAMLQKLQDALADHGRFAASVPVPNDVDSELPDFSSIGEVSRHFGLNDKQHGAFCIAGAALLKSIKRGEVPIEPVEETAEDEQLMMILCGEGGSGKSRVIHALKALGSSWKKPHAVVVTAPTGIAASAFKGRTIHALLSIGVNSGANLSDRAKEKLKETLSSVHMLIVDECSMIGRAMFAVMNSHTRIGTGERKPFGGLGALFCGDFNQLPPVTILCILSKQISSLIK